MNKLTVILQTDEENSEIIKEAWRILDRQLAALLKETSLTVLFVVIGNLDFCFETLQAPRDSSEHAAIVFATEETFNDDEVTEKLVLAGAASVYLAYDRDIRSGRVVAARVRECILNHLKD